MDSLFVEEVAASLVREFLSRKVGRAASTAQGRCPRVRAQSRGTPASSTPSERESSPLPPPAPGIPDASATFPGLPKLHFPGVIAAPRSAHWPRRPAAAVQRWHPAPPAEEAARGLARGTARSRGGGPGRLPPGLLNHGRLVAAGRERSAQAWQSRPVARSTTSTLPGKKVPPREPKEPKHVPDSRTLQSCSSAVGSSRLPPWLF